MPAFILLTVMTALRILSRNRLRAGLTMLGIVIGVGAVIAMVSIGQGARAAVQAQVASMGTNVIIIMPGSTTVGGVRGGQGGADRGRTGEPWRFAGRDSHRAGGRFLACRAQTPA